MPKQLVRLLIAFALFISLFLVVRHFLVPDSFYELGHYRADALKDIEATETIYADSKLCANCHAKIDSIKKPGAHGAISCQTCHGAGNKHISDPAKNKLGKQTTREFCGKCHNKNAARPSSIRQVDITKHNVKSLCVKCHNPHSPSKKAKGAGSKDSASADNAAGSSAGCSSCHGEINTFKSTGMHKSLTCQGCHGTGEKHMEDPAANVLAKPGERANCGKCHGKGVAPATNGITQIDLNEHNTGSKCIECHKAHSPLEFK